MMLALARLLISMAAAIVPSALRGDWSREWQAELWHRHRALEAAGRLSFVTALDLVLRSAGAVVHALWLRKEEWSVGVLMQDVRYAVRGLRQRPVFTAVAVAMLAAGIGANAAAFSVVHAVLLRPLPYHEPDRLVQIWETNPLRNWTENTVAPANMLDWRDRSRSFAGMASYFGSDTRAAGLIDATLTGTGEPERVRGMSVSGNFFAVLGAAPVEGRTFLPDEEQNGRHRVVVLAEGFWRRRFASDPAVVGRRIELNGTGYEVIGVMPRAFQLPGADADYWAPRVLDEAQLRSQRRPHYFRVIARLAPGVTIGQARADVVQIMRDLEREYPDTNTQMSAGLGPLHDWFVGTHRRAVLLLMAAVGVVLLIACANVASLLLARATTRRRELAIRVALGAGRLRLFRQMLTESLVLAATGAVVGGFVASVTIAWLRTHGPEGVPRLDRIAIDGWVLGFLVVVTSITAIVFGFAPAWQSVRAAPADTLQESGRAATAGGATLRRLLIGGEVALAVVLLVTAGLVVRSVGHLRGVDPGIEVPGGLSFRLTLPGRSYDSPEKISGFYAGALERIRAVEGVTGAGAVARLALEGFVWTSDLYIDGRPEVQGRELRHKAITPGYFNAAGIPLLEGRDFTAADSAASERVVVVNQTMARTHFAGANPIGQRVVFGRPTAAARWRTIVGVAADEKQDGLSAEVRPEVYEPLAQDPRATMSIVVRTSGDPLQLVPAVRAAVASIDARLALYDIRTLAQVVDHSLAEERFAAVVLAAFAGVALVLAAVGLYGIIAFSVTSRTREIGLRLALGATRSAVLGMIVWDGLRVVLAGLLVGLVLALAAAWSVRAFLFRTPAADPLVLAAVIGLLAATGVLASYLPALRASRVDPSVSLRSE